MYRQENAKLVKCKLVSKFLEIHAQYLSMSRMSKIKHPHTNVYKLQVYVKK